MKRIALGLIMTAVLAVPSAASANASPAQPPPVDCHIAEGGINISISQVPLNIDIDPITDDFPICS